MRRWRRGLRGEGAEDSDQSSQSGDLSSDGGTGRLSGGRRDHLWRGANRRFASYTEISDSDDEDSSGGEYEVERVVEMRRSTSGTGFEYKVRWVGFGPDDDTWEPMSEDLRSSVDAYLMKKGNAEPCGPFSRTHARQ